MKRWRADSAELNARTCHWLTAALADMRKACILERIPISGNWGQAITIDNHRFSEALDFNGAIFFNAITFYKLPVSSKALIFRFANFALGASFSGSEFLDEVDFGQARFHVGAMFHSVTFGGQADFFCRRPDDHFGAAFSECNI
jgi:hypothetical protein